jgi:carbamoyltransferase
MGKIKLGVSAFYHDSAVALSIDGRVVLAAEEERFTGIKHDNSFPKNALLWVLRQSRLQINDINEIHWYENPNKKDDRVKTIFNKRPIKTFFLRRRYNKDRKNNSPEALLKSIGYTGKIIYHDHHYSHAAFSYFTSNYRDAAILTVDGVGEWETTTISKGTGNNIEKLISIDFPNSLGMLYSTITSYLGFRPNEGEYKVMGLAPYGDPSQYIEKLEKVLHNTSNKFYIDQKYFTWEYSDRIMFNTKLCQLLELPPRLPEDTLTQEHKNLAAALQKLYEREFLKLVETAKNITGSQNLCLGGGCAYNGVANSLAYKYFDSIHIPFAPSDAGSAIGAVLDTHTDVSPYLGPEFTPEVLRLEVNRFKDKVLCFKLTEEKLIKKVAKILSSQSTVAWFQGKMEFGARALGNRSILASPTDPKMREKLNSTIKKRESFRPFAPSVTEEDASKFFQIKESVPFMNQVVKAKVKFLPAATHIDGTCRVHTVTKKQNKKYYNLLREMKRLTGTPVLLNTSFNLKDQTITISPSQAIERYLNSEIDFLVIDNYLIKRK